MALRQQQQLSPRREAVTLTRKSVAQRHSDQAEMWLDRTAFEELIHPPLAETVETLRSESKTRVDLKATVTPVPTTVEVSELSDAAIPPGSADVPERRRAPRRFTRFAAAGILALVGGAASVPLITAHSGSIATTAVRNPAPVAPVAAIPAPDPGDSPPSEKLNAAPVAAPNTPAEGTAPSGVAPVRTPQTVRSTSRSRPPTTMMTSPAPRTPAIPPEAYAVWSRMAELSANDQARTRFHRDAAPHR